LFKAGVQALPALQAELALQIYPKTLARLLIRFAPTLSDI